MSGRWTTTLIVLMAALSAALWAAPGAAASDLIARDATGVKLGVNKRGVALVRYRKGGRTHRVLAWGALNADRLKFAMDRSGGWKSKKADWKRFDNVCGRYSGPPLDFLLTGCTAPDGSHWVLQQWMRGIGKDRINGQAELRLSHFTGEPAELRIWTDWYRKGRYAHMWGQYLYKGKPWYGDAWRPDGYALDNKSRNVYIDSWESDIGTGWRRVNAFLSNRPNGQFCFGFGPKPGFPYEGRSATEQYRARVVGPGVSPDIEVHFVGQTVPYDPEIDAIHNWWQGYLVNWAEEGPCSVRN